MYLGLDLGTSGLRAVLMRPEGAVVAVSEQSYGVSHPHPGWSEQDPAEWLRACGAAVQDLRSRVAAEFAALKGIGLSGQMHGAVLLDAAGAVLRPCILWNDSRAAREAAELDADPDFRAISGNIVFAGFTAPKLLWCARHEPDLFARVAKVVLPKDYLRLWLSGDCVTEMSDGSGTGWLDVCGRAWSEVLLEKSGMRAAQMPGLIEGSAVSGHLRPALAGDWGVGRGVAGPGVIVAGGGADNAAAACGAGCLDEGQGLVSLGTSGVLLVARENCAPDPATAVHTFCHAVPQRWVQMGVILAATDCLNWLARNLGQTPAALSALTDAALGPPSPVQFLPDLSGDRTPHNDARIRAALIGLDIADGPADLTRAVMQGVAFALRDCLEALHATGADPARLLAIGGGAQSLYWLRALATILKLPLDLPRAGELGAALGAARLAHLADGGADAAAIMARPEVAQTIHPAADLVDEYDAAYQRYRALYPAVRALT